MMKYALEHDNELLKAFRDEFPMDQAASDRIKRSDILSLQEAVLAHYEINSRTDRPLKNKALEGIDFFRFINEVDIFGIVDSFRRSLAAGTVERLNVYGLLEPVKRTVYANWATEKGLALPECLTGKIIPWEPPALVTVEDAKGLPYDKMPLSVIACVQANLIAQMHKRSKPKIKRSEVYNSQAMQSYLKLHATVDGKEIKVEDTIRGYIDHQFP